jgi:putative membrane protein
MKTYLKSLIAPVCTGTLLLVGAMFAQTPSMTENPYPENPSAPVVRDKHDLDPKNDTDRKIPRADRRFFTQAVRLGEKEVTLSRIAAERATNSQVRAFASEMVTAHTAANAELATIIRQRGVRIDDRDRAIEQRELAKKWNEKKAADFDEDYLKAIIDAHEDTIDALENGADSKDGDISAYARKLLPTVKTHLDRAEKLEDQVD